MIKLSDISRPAKTLTCFLIGWIILNLLQAAFTPLNHDEAYYWMYSKYLAWGYFDHPPMIALMIRIGYFIFHNELGVRLISVISSAVSLVVVWALTNNGKRGKAGAEWIFIMLAGTLPLFHIFGFMATPDSPLLLFTALFLLAFKKFSGQDKFQTAFLLGISMAALMYSKYHGALLIIFVILSNLRLLRTPWFYFSAVLALVLFLPHINWQFVNGFPSLRFHLVERVSGFNPGNIPDYLLNLLLIHNPLIFPLTLLFVFRKKVFTSFEKTLVFILVGFIIFFFIQSFRYHIEPQWTAIITVPMIIILFNNLDFHSAEGKYLRNTAIFFIPLILFARIAFMIDFLPVHFLKKEYHNTRKREDAIARLAGDRPVIFTNSYQEPSEYTFYTGRFALSLNNLNYRKTQYDIWNFEEKVHGKEILYVPHYLNDYITDNFTKVKFPWGDSTYVKVIKDFQSLQKECVILERKSYTFSATASDTIHLKIFNPYPFPINLRHQELPVVFQLAFLRNGSWEFKKNLELPPSVSMLNVNDTLKLDCSFTLEDLPPGKYKIAISSETGYLYDVYNSHFADAEVK